LAAADFKQIEKSGSERVGRAARSEWAKIKSAGADAPRGIAARVGVRKADFQHGGRTQARALAIIRRPEAPRVLPVQKAEFKRRAHDAVAHARGEFAQIQPLRRGIGRAQQAREALPQIRGAQQVGFRASEFHTRLDGKIRGACRDALKTFSVAGWVEFNRGIELLHSGRREL
jgi:hypothetical protein